VPQAKSGFEGWHDFAFAFRDPQFGWFSGAGTAVSASDLPSDFVFRRFCEIGNVRMPNHQSRGQQTTGHSVSRRQLPRGNLGEGAFGVRELDLVQLCQVDRVAGVRDPDVYRVFRPLVRLAVHEHQRGLDGGRAGSGVVLPEVGGQQPAPELRRAHGHVVSVGRGVGVPVRPVPELKVCGDGKQPFRLRY